MKGWCPVVHRYNMIHTIYNKSWARVINCLFFIFMTLCSRKQIIDECQKTSRKSQHSCPVLTKSNISTWREIKLPSDNIAVLSLPVWSKEFIELFVLSLYRDHMTYIWSLYLFRCLLTRIKLLLRIKLFVRLCRPCQYLVSLLHFSHY